MALPETALSLSVTVLIPRPFPHAIPATQLVFTGHSRRPLADGGAEYQVTAAANRALILAFSTLAAATALAATALAVFPRAGRCPVAGATSGVRGQGPWAYRRRQPMTTVRGISD